MSVFLWSQTCSCALECLGHFDLSRQPGFFQPVIGMNWPFVLVKWEENFNIEAADGAEGGFKVLQAVASRCLLGLKVVLICASSQLFFH